MTHILQVRTLQPGRGNYLKSDSSKRKENPGMSKSKLCLLSLAVVVISKHLLQEWGGRVSLKLSASSPSLRQSIHSHWELGMSYDPV